MVGLPDGMIDGKVLILGDGLGGELAVMVGLEETSSTVLCTGALQQPISSMRQR
jgi:hypothetical protein